MILDSPIISGSSTVTGDLTVLGTLIANVSGSSISASYATNAELLDGLDSTSFTTTSSFNTASGSFSTRVTNNEATGSSLTTASGSFSTRVTNNEGSITSLTQNVVSLFTTSASLNSRVNNLDTASGSFSTRTTNLETASGSFSTRTTNLETASGSFSTRVTNAESNITSLNSKTGSYATTGSNNFNGNQVITGSLTTTGTITAQTLNVQQVTSSIVYSSGSNIFGNSVSNTQQFTGSVLITGSLAVNAGTTTVGILTGSSALFSSQVDGTIFNSTSNAFRFSGNNAISLVSLNSQNVVKINAAGYWGTQLVGANDQGILINNTGLVGLGTTTPGSRLHIVDSSGPVIRLVRTSNRFDVEADNNAMGAVSRDSSTAPFYFSGFSGVGIGTTSPAADLQVGKSSDVVVAMSNSSSVTSGNRGSIAWYNSSVSTVAVIRAAAVTDNVGTELQFFTRPADGNLAQVFTIASTGAATFSSTAQDCFTINTTNSDGPVVRIQNSGTNIGFFGNAEGVTNGGATNFAIRSTNNLIFSTGGANPRMTILSGGNVGIGTTSIYGKLHVFSTATSPSLTVGTAAAAIISCAEGQELAITANGTAPYGIAFQGRNNNGGGPSGTSYPIIFNPLGGNVGIGTTSPQSQLHIYNNSAGATFRLQGTRTADGEVGVINFSNITDIAGGYIIGSIAVNRSGFDNGGAMIFSTATAASTPTERMRIENGYSVRYTSNNASNATFDLNYRFSTPDSARIRFQTTPSFNLNEPGEISFWTRANDAQGGGLVTERMRITSNGNVGINTTSPVGKLDVALLNTRRFIVTYDDSIVTIKGASDTGAPENLRMIGDNLIFNTGTTGSGTERMRITSGGLFGINTTAPDTRLNIAAATEAATGFTDFFKIGSASTTFSSIGGYPSLLIGTIGVYDAAIATIGSDLRIYSGRGVSSENHNIRFYTGFNGTGGAAENNERMRIEYNGNVGINQSSPTLGKLQITGDNNQLAIHTTGDYSSIYFYNGSNDRAGIYVSNTETHFEGRGSSGLFFGGAVSQNHMVITSGGNVGIGTTSPATTLDVSGLTRSTNGFITNRGTVSLASSASSNIFNLSGTNGVYTVAIYVSGGSNIYVANAVFIANGGNDEYTKVLDIFDGANVTLDLNGTNVRITNNGFATLTWSWSYTFQPFN